MKNTIAILFLLLTGCACDMPKEVDIPIAYQQPSVAIPKKPVLPIVKLNKDSKPDVVIKSYASSVEILQGYSDQLIELLKAYQ
jgi:hypothetical protein